MDDRMAKDIARSLTSIERSLQSIARDMHTQTTMLVDERASIEQGEPNFQAGQLGRVSLSWTQEPELRGAQVVLVEALMIQTAAGEDAVLHYVVQRPDRDGVTWTIPAVAFIAE